MARDRRRSNNAAEYRVFLEIFILGYDSTPARRITETVAISGSPEHRHGGGRLVPHPVVPDRLAGRGQTSGAVAGGAAVYAGCYWIVDGATVRKFIRTIASRG